MLNTTFPDPYTEREKQLVLRDLHQSIRTAHENKNESKIFYNQQLIDADNDEERYAD
jgi:hypothetical protein